ncbi:BMP family lipoprotein [Gluconacetobacter diazotrophicus]|nr:BMP family ABC transporter substrate-binding protein [Gluconacetobacter diazotrophicus]
MRHPQLTAVLVSISVAGALPAASCPARSAEAPHAVLVVGQGGLGDQSYNDLGTAGFLQGVRDIGVTGRIVETASVVSEGADILRQAAAAGFGLIVDLEYAHGAVIAEVAPQFARCRFVTLNQVVHGPNITSILFQEQEGSYLAGVLAAASLRDRALPGLDRHAGLGVIGGVRSAGIDKFIVGFIQGARSIDPKITIHVAYANSFGDPALGFEMARAMYRGGVGIIYAVAGTTGIGAIRAARDMNRYAIGVDQDEDGLAPGHVLTSMVKHTDLAVRNVVRSWHDGTLPDDGVIRMGLASGGIGLSDMRFTRAILPPDVLSDVARARSDILNDHVHVWDVTAQGYPDFYQ